MHASTASFGALDSNKGVNEETNDDEYEDLEDLLEYSADISKILSKSKIKEIAEQ